MVAAAVAAAAKSLQSCPTLCDPIDSSPPGSLIPGILQARTLEWVAILDGDYNHPEFFSFLMALAFVDVLLFSGNWILVLTQGIILLKSMFMPL